MAASTPLPSLKLATILELAPNLELAPILELAPNLEFAPSLRSLCSLRFSPLFSDTRFYFNSIKDNFDLIAEIKSSIFSVKPPDLFFRTSTMASSLAFSV